MAVYFSVKTTDAQKCRWFTTAVKLSGAFHPRLPANSPQSETDIRVSSNTGTTKNSSTMIAVGAA